MRRINGTDWLFVASLLAGCQRVDISSPPTVRFGDEACASCHMIISDERFAAALVTAAGDALKFDDIGCLIQHEAPHARPEVTYWVRDYSSQGWLNARDATFVQSTSVLSPMGHGMAALPTALAARELASGPTSRILRFSELPGFRDEQPNQASPNLSSQDHRVGP
jgi:copper chaperone NosL